MDLQAELDKERAAKVAAYGMLGAANVLIESLTRERDAAQGLLAELRRMAEDRDTGGLRTYRGLNEAIEKAEVQIKAKRIHAKMRSLAGR